jgi:hypothetical protein
MPRLSEISAFVSPATSAGDGRTKHEDDASTRGKSVDFVRDLFTILPQEQSARLAA